MYREYIFLFFGFLFLGCSCSAQGATTTCAEEFTQRIYSQVLIKDFHTAIEEGTLGMQLFPNSCEILRALVFAYSEGGRSKEAIEIFQKILEKEHLDLKVHFSLIEDLAWGVLREASSQSRVTHMNALIGAYLTQDARAIPLLIEAMRSSNTYLRALAARLAAQYGDKVLGMELLRLIKEEKNWFVRLEVLDGIAKFRLKEAKPVLQQMIDDEGNSSEEKVLGIKALTFLYDDLPSEERKNLLHSPRAMQRLLGLELIKKFRVADVGKELFPLLEDSSIDVRVAALHLLATMQDVSGHSCRMIILEKIDQLLHDPHPHLSIVAAWVIAQYDTHKAVAIFKKWLSSDQPQMQRYAAAVLSATGFLGSIHVKEMFYQVTDPYVKANLAIGMLGQRVGVSEAAEFLFSFLNQTKGLLAFERQDGGMFKVLVPSEHRHTPHIPRYPLLVDRFTRLEILNHLTIVGYERSEELIRSFLREGLWGPAGSAAALLIEEGDFQALDVVHKLLTDRDEKIVLQAALALAFLGKDYSVRPLLEESFAKVEWEQQVYILEALGALGDREAIPFLIEILHRPFQELRIIAASSIIQCLYH